MIRSATADDHAQLYALWQRSEGICVRDEDGYAPFCRYLQRNPQLSLVGQRTINGTRCPPSQLSRLMPRQGRAPSC